MASNSSKHLVRFAVLFLCALSAVMAFCQPGESRPGPGDRSNNLKQRYRSLVCAIALINTERGSGTGFYVDRRGDLVTAAHVVSTKSFKIVQNQLSFDVSVDKHILLTPNGQPQVELDSSTVDVDSNESSHDLAFIHTHTNPPCWIPLGDSTATETGDHLLSIGFPGIDNGHPILYDGFLSGRFKHPPMAVGQVNGQPIIPNYEILKVQMPITPGASGSPVIDDSGHAIAVISESPMVWTNELESITHVAGIGSGITLSGYDAVKILGQLAIVVREFETTGSGYAVPISDLRPTRGAVHSGSTPSR